MGFWAQVLGFIAVALFILGQGGLLSGGGTDANGIQEFEDPFDYNHYSLNCTGLSDISSSQYTVIGVVTNGIFTGAVDVRGQNGTDRHLVTQNDFRLSTVDLRENGHITMAIYWTFEDIINPRRGIIAAGPLDDVAGSWLAMPTSNSVDNYGENAGGGLKFSKNTNPAGGCFVTPL